MEYGKFIEIEAKPKSLIMSILVKDLNFVSKFPAKDNSRPMFKYALFEEGKLIASDGRRMVIYSEPNLKNMGFESGGYYKYLRGTAKLSWWAKLAEKAQGFPNWKKITVDMARDPESNCKYTAYGMNKPEFSKEYFKLMKTNPVNINHIKDLPVGYEWDITFFGKGKMIRLVSNYLEVYIMPLGDD